MRRRLPWLIALPLMVAGSLAAHAVTYLLVSARIETDGHELGERSSTSLASHSVLMLGAGMAVIAAAGLGWLVGHARGRPRRGAPPWLFFVLPPLAFGLQELSERLLHAEAAPFQAALEPRFLIGLVLQLPFGLVALLAARALLRVVRQIVRALAHRRPVTAARCRAPVVRLPAFCELPRIPALALGYPQRGPPAR